MMSFGNTLRRVLKGPLTTALALGFGVALLTVLDGLSRRGRQCRREREKDSRIRRAKHRAVQGLPDRLSNRVRPEPLLLGAARRP